MKIVSLYVTALCAALAVTTLGGCAAVALGGAAAATGLVATDRRSLDTQLEDKSIDASATNAARALMDDRGHVAVASYYRKVLLTGEVPSAEDRLRVQAAVQKTKGVQGVVNELAVMPPSTLGQRSEDTLTTARVKANLVNATGVPSNSIKVVTTRGTTYLMGRLTRRETDLATEVARTTPGVQRVVRVIDFISEQSALHPNDAGGVSPGPAPITSVDAPASGGGATGAISTPVGQPPVIQQPPVEVTPLPPAR